MGYTSVTTQESALYFLEATSEEVALFHLTVSGISSFPSAD